MQSSGKSAVFFYITSSGRIVTRKAGDYITKMIEMAGGKNVFDFIGDDNAMSAVTLEPEKFCMHAKDADIIIYNCNISGEIHSIAELTAKNELLREFRAVKNGNVWCTGRSVYQDIMKTGDILTDMHTVFADTGEETTYLYKIS
ncbi:MAG: ABC transporter substrate-binding protein [Ruminiclostridium sp.]|nr:ABC transporter substrate-binding protein [Ruminiclostridium sp.]